MLPNNATPTPTESAIAELAEQLPDAAIAFRGYNITNLGKTKALLSDPRYAGEFNTWLNQASQVAADRLKRPVDLTARVLADKEFDLASFAEAVAYILAVESAQMAVLKRLQLPVLKASYAFGYSLGEIGALVAGGVFSLEDALWVILGVAQECAALADSVTMGVLFSRQPEFNLAEIEQLCLEINCSGQGLIFISSQLSPNTVLLLGQGDTLDQFARQMRTRLSVPCHLRKKGGSWPPLHTPMLWAGGLVNRASLDMFKISGGMSAPVPPVLSLVTGELSYNAANSRQLLSQWMDHPQRLWDAIGHTLAEGVSLLVHVGPEPNLIPATFKRIADNVRQMTAQNDWRGLGLRAVSPIVNRPWLSRVVSQKVTLLRAPFVSHLVVEDWLLALPQ